MRTSTITVLLEVQNVWVDPACPELRKLAIRTVTPVNNSTGFQLVQRSVQLSLDTGGDFDPQVLRFQRGYLPAICEILRRAGHHFNISLNSPRVSQLPEAGACPYWVDYSYRAAIDAVAANDAAVIQVLDEHEGRASLIYQVCAAFPNCRILAICASLRPLLRIAAAPCMRAIKPRVSTGDTALTIDSPSDDELDGCSPIENNSSPANAKHAQLILATLAGLPPHFAAHADIVFWVDATHALHERGRLAVEACLRARHFGFLPAKRTLTVRQLDELSGVFGFARVQLGEHYHAERPVRVHQLRVGARDSNLCDAQKGDILLRLQSSGSRNNRIAHLAQAVLTSGLTSISKAAAELIPHCRGVAVVVEGLAHALALARMLPTWKIRAAKVIEENLTPANRELYTSQKDLATNTQIVTFAALGDLDLADIDVVIRADGGSGNLPLRSISNYWPARPLLVVDVTDRHHPLLRRWVRQRQKAYVAAGWAPVGWTPEQVAVHQFVDRMEGRHVAT